MFPHQNIETVLAVSRLAICITASPTLLKQQQYQLLNNRGDGSLFNQTLTITETLRVCVSGIATFSVACYTRSQ
jgi:hypothetical protein